MGLVGADDALELSPKIYLVSKPFAFLQVVNLTKNLLSVK